MLYLDVHRVSASRETKTILIWWYIIQYRRARRWWRVSVSTRNCGWQIGNGARWYKLRLGFSSQASDSFGLVLKNWDPLKTDIQIFINVMKKFSSGKQSLLEFAEEVRYLLLEPQKCNRPSLSELYWDVMKLNWETYQHLRNSLKKG